MTRNNDKGMSLVEVLVAMVILLFVSLAMMQTALLAIDTNMRTAIADEANKVAEERLSMLRNAAISNGVVSTGTTTVQRTVRNVAVNYKGTPGYRIITNSVAYITNPGNQRPLVEVYVSWSWKDMDFIENPNATTKATEKAASVTANRGVSAGVKMSSIRGL